jgi:hypothetical protein
MMSLMMNRMRRNNTSIGSKVHALPYKLIRPYTNPALYQMDVPALSYIYAAYGKSCLISIGKE